MDFDAASGVAASSAAAIFGLFFKELWDSWFSDHSEAAFVSLRILSEILLSREYIARC